MTSSNNTLQKIELHKQSNILELHYDGLGHDGLGRFELSCEYLRVHSPSAEVKGHSPDQAVLQTGKRDVAINTIEAVGNYAVKFHFSDGHDSGIYSWDYLKELCVNQEQYWQDYLRRLHAAGKSRDPDTSVIKLEP